MEFDRLKRFEKAHRKLAQKDKQKVEKALEKFSIDPVHPSLHVEKIVNNVWSIRASDKIRITFEFDGDLKALKKAMRITLRNVGSHAVYDAP